MDKQIIFWGVLIVSLIFVSSCTSSAVKCEPVVVVTGEDYTSDPLAVPYQDTHEEFAENYSGEDLSIELRDEIIERMREKAGEIGEDPEVLYQCIKATYSDWDERPMRIPSYAEKCVYQDESIWAIAFNRANSFEESSLEHFDLFFVASATYDTLYHTGCYGGH
ncbi:MAG: hypothetical protein JSV97_11765 [candidate division WOR-3 bacterium]|nr:MAG: hypothetical protein JSV97_11765 [candidate division WOR-3 bacterium]